MRLSDVEESILHGDSGDGPRRAMAMVVALAEATDAPSLIEVTQAHIDGCLFHGQAGIDYVKQFADTGTTVAVPTTLNVASLDLLHPELFRGAPDSARLSRELMDLHVALGCSPTWTCAPYQLPTRPGLGEQIAWGESNAIVFANSVLGARTNRYGDFIDLACAITGRAPAVGLHTEEGRVARIEVELSVPDAMLDDDIFYPTLGLWIGFNVSEIPVIVGLDDRASEDRLKALGAAGASSGALAMFHALGVTPEASDRDSLPVIADIPKVNVDEADLAEVRERVGRRVGSLGAVSLGTPHMSSVEMATLASKVAGLRSRVPFYINTSRHVLAAARQETLDALAEFGATLVTDTCTYITPILGEIEGAVMTDSGKWAYYAPGNLGVDVVFGGVADCVESAAAGRIVLTDSLVHGA